MESKRRGPVGAKILIVGEYPSQTEVQQQSCFLGTSTTTLAQMLVEAGINPDDIAYTTVLRNACDERSVQQFFPSNKKQATAASAVYVNGKYCTGEVIHGLSELEKDILAIRPNIVIALGDISLWATTGNRSISSWRGSILEGTCGSARFKTLPTYTPASTFRMYNLRWILIHDLKRAARDAAFSEVRRKPVEFLLRPTFGDTMDYLNLIRSRLEEGVVQNLAVDLETRATHIACIGIADTLSTAICIPLICIENPAGYWNQEEEFQIYKSLRDILTHKNAFIIGQNYTYDLQYIAMRMGFRSNFNYDTMVAHQVCFPGTQKSLDFISSLYCEDYFYWKDEGKEWNPRLHDEDRLWNYNCLDAINTLGCFYAIDKNIDALNLREQFNIQMVDAHHAFNLMLRGVRVNHKVKTQMAVDITEAMQQRLDFLQNVFGYPVNVNSPIQMQKILYEIFKLPAQKKKRKTGDGIRYTASAGKDAIEDLLKVADPIFRPILQAIVEYRSLKVYKTTFAEASVDRWDGRLRCSINVAGPETFRWSTSSDAFGTGMNLQNIPRNR